MGKGPSAVRMVSLREGAFSFFPDNTGDAIAIDIAPMRTGEDFL